MASKERSELHLVFECLTRGHVGSAVFRACPVGRPACRQLFLPASCTRGRRALPGVGYCAFLEGESICFASSWGSPLRFTLFVSKPLPVCKCRCRPGCVWRNKFTICGNSTGTKLLLFKVTCYFCFCYTWPNQPNTVASVNTSTPCYKTSLLGGQ